MTLENLLGSRALVVDRYGRYGPEPEICLGPGLRGDRYQSKLMGEVTREGRSQPVPDAFWGGLRGSLASSVGSAF